MTEMVVNEEQLNNINHELLDYTKKLIETLPTVAKLFRDNKTIEANAIFTQMIEGLEWVDKYISIVGGDNKKILVDFRNVKEIRNDFMLTVSNLLNMHKNKKWLDIADVLDNKLKSDIEIFLKIIVQLEGV